MGIGSERRNAHAWSAGIGIGGLAGFGHPETPVSADCRAEQIRTISVKIRVLDKLKKIAFWIADKDGRDSFADLDWLFTHLFHFVLLQAHHDLVKVRHDEGEISDALPREYPFGNR